MFREDQKFCVWDIECIRQRAHAVVVFDLEFPTEDNVTCVLHPDTYLNKILIDFESGLLQLWNFKTKKVIFCLEIVYFLLYFHSGSVDSKIVVDAKISRKYFFY